MILRPKPSLRHHGTLAGATAAAPMTVVPTWLRQAIPDAQSLAGKDVEHVAAAVTAKQAGPVEDESALRDAVLLTRPGDSFSVVPAGLLLLAWRRLAARPAEELVTLENLAAVLEEFGYAADDEVVSDLADDLRQLAASAGMVETLVGAFAAAVAPVR